MIIIGCDFHTRYQQIAMLDESTGELSERRLEHENREARSFYRALPRPVRVGVASLPLTPPHPRDLPLRRHLGGSPRIHAGEATLQRCGNDGPAREAPAFRAASPARPFRFAAVFRV